MRLQAVKSSHPRSCIIRFFISSVNLCLTECVNNSTMKRLHIEEGEKDSMTSSSEACAHCIHDQRKRSNVWGWNESVMSLKEVSRLLLLVQNIVNSNIVKISQNNGFLVQYDLKYNLLLWLQSQICCRHYANVQCHMTFQNILIY